LKRNASTSKYQRQIFQAMRPVFADLVSEIQRSIGFYGTVHRDSRIKRIIALGSTFRLPTLQKYLHQNLQVDVDRIDGFSGGAPADGRLGAMLNENLVSLGTAYGLAVQAMGNSKITSSLLPEPIRKAKIWREKTKWFGLAAAMFCAGTAGVVAKWYLDTQLYERQGTLRTTIDNTIKSANTADVNWSKTQDDGAPDRKRIRDVNEMRVGWDVWPKLIGDIANAVPDQPVIKDVTAAPKRETREQIIIDSITREYRPNMDDVIAATEVEFRNMSGEGGGTAASSAFTASREIAPPPPSGGGGGRGRGGPVAPPPVQAPPSGTGTLSATGARGFMLTIKCTTPNKGGSDFVQANLVKKLLEITAAESFKQKKPYYIAKAAIIAETHVKDAGGATGGGFNPNLGGGAGRGRFETERPPVTARPPVNTGAVQPGIDPNQPEAVIPFPDPLTNESMAEDWVLVVKVGVVLDPPAPAPVTPTTPTTTPPTPKGPAGPRAAAQ
jgi:type IV pilus assembly protein PilM